MFIRHIRETGVFDFDKVDNNLLNRLSLNPEKISFKISGWTET